MQGRRGDWGPNPTDPSAKAQLGVRRVKRRWRTMGGGGAVARWRWWWCWAPAFAKARQEGGLGAKSHGSERDGSICGAPCQTAVEDDGGRWRGDVDKVVVVVRMRVRAPVREEGARAKKKPKNRAITAQFWVDPGCRWGSRVFWGVTEPFPR